MANGLEVRPPFLDHELLELAARIPSRWKVHDGETKWVLKQAYARDLGPEREGIEKLIRQCDLGRHVRLLGLRTDVARLLSAADLFLLTSISEGIPLTVIEAMAAGLPVVATGVGGLAEVVEEGKTALLAPAGDAGALAGNVLRLAEDPGLRAAMGRRGRERAFARFSEDQMLDRYKQLYEELARR